MYRENHHEEGTSGRALSLLSVATSVALCGRELGQSEALYDWLEAKTTSFRFTRYFEEQVNDRTSD